MTLPVPVPERDAAPGWAKLLPYGLERVWAPEVYQGGARRNGYFEGWYIKCVDATRKHAIAFIPGVSQDARGGQSHSFVQVVRPGGRTAYLEYPVERFEFDRRRFGVTIGANRFSSEGIALDLEGPGTRVQGTLRFGPWRPWPVKLLTPGIMGWYRFVPRMETYHGVCSLDHRIDGDLLVDGERICFDGGRGYVEKDWGRSFPSSWVWAQSNHFARSGVSITVSVAKIPWMGTSFVGFIAGVLLDGQLYRFTTYSGCKLTAFSSRPGGATMTFEDRDFRLEVELDGAAAAPLRAPRHGRMVARADESLDATIRARLVRRRNGELLLDDRGLHAGCEVMNDRGELEAGLLLEDRTGRRARDSRQREPGEHRAAGR